MAAPSPSGTAVSRAIRVVHAVAVIRGKTPNDAGLKRGAHRSPNRNSVTGTFWKKPTAGIVSAIRMPTVMRMESPAARRIEVRTANSPGRTRFVRPAAGWPGASAGPPFTGASICVSATELLRLSGLVT